MTGRTTQAGARAPASNGDGDPAGLNAKVAEAKVRAFEVKGEGKTLELPRVPAHDDLAGLCAWLTSVLRLDRHHPVTGVVLQGLRGPEGHAVIRRAGAPPIRFEPVTAMNTTRRLLPILSWQLIKTDGEPYGFRDGHARRIAHVVRLLGAEADTQLEAEETSGIVGALLQEAIAVEGMTTHGTGEQRYEALGALQREEDARTGWAVGPPRYLIDSATGEYVIRVSDLQATARKFTGSSLPRGWLDGRMDDLGWTRRTIDAHALPGRAGRTGPHRRVSVYLGFLTPLHDGEAAAE